jgi:hypothetical protein
MMTSQHVQDALAGMRPSTTKEQVARYQAFARKHGGWGGKRRLL